MLNLLDNCPHGWTILDKNCYKVPEEKKNWNDAIQFCQEIDGKLAEPKNLEQNEKIANLVKQKHGSERFFIGIHDQIEESK